MSKAKGNPRKFSEKIALLNKKEAEGNAEFQRILREVEETTRAAPPMIRFEHQNHYQQHHLRYHHDHGNQLNIDQPHQYWPTRSSSFSNWPTSLTTDSSYNQAQYQQDHQLRPRHQHHLQQPQQQAIFVDNVEQPRQVQDVYIGDSPILHQQQVRHTEQTIQYQQPILTETSQDCSNLTAEEAHQTNHLLIREVPNIEIFSIEDNYNYPQHDTSSIATHHPNNNNLTNGYRNNTSPTLISSTRSLPNIACLSVAGSPSCQPELTPALSQQRLIPSNDLNISSAITSTGSSAATTTTTVIHCNRTSSNNNLNNNHIFDDATNGIYLSDQQDYCSLPIQPYQNIDITQNQAGLNSQANVLDPPWQQVATTSVPSSPVHTPPPLLQHPNDPQIHMTSPSQPSLRIVTTHDYTPTDNQSLRPQFSAYGPTMVRASSTNMLNRFESNDLLNARPINTNLSRSTELCHRYLPT